MKKRTWFPQLHVHDEHSIKDGCSTVETYADIVADIGGRSLCVTNHGQAAGWARQYFACKDRGLKPIVGMEAYINEHRLKPIRALIEELGKKVKAKVPGAKDDLLRAQAFLKESFRPSPHAILLALNREGYRNMVRMSTDSWLNGFYYNPRTDTRFLSEHAEGLAYSTACIGGFIPRMARENFDLACKASRRLQRAFSGEFYVEIMMTEYEAQRETNRVMLKLAHEVGAPVIVTCDVHYARKQDAVAQDVLLLMRDKKTFADKFEGDGGAGIWQFEAKDLWWRTLEDVLDCWRSHHADYVDKETISQAIRNTYALADKVEGFEFDEGLKLPGVFPRPEARLKDLAAKGMRWRVERGDCPAPGKLKREYVERLKFELGVINTKGFAEYFLVLHDIMEHARAIGARTGPGRGSAGGCLVAYLLRITEIDPLRFGLLFERFLAVDRPDPPDIDLDFSPQHRDSIKDYVAQRYPATATIGTYGTFKPRATLRDVGKVFGADWKEMVKVTKPLGDDADGKTWDQIFSLWPHVERWARDNPDAFEVVKVLKGLISYRGKHAAAMLVAPASALDDLPMVTEATGQVVTAFPDTQGDGVTYKGREMTRLGYLKVDILGVQNLNIAPLAAEIVLREIGEEVDVDRLPLDDPEALRVASTGDVPGVSQLDTETTRPILRHVGVDSFADLCMITALARPGPLKHQIHRVFAKLKRQGDGWVRNVHPELVPLLQDSRGLMILQEDVMHVVQVLGGLTFPEANAVRKAMAKKHDEEAFLPWWEKFRRGGLERGHEEALLEETWSKIVTFSDYGFNKAHAVAYMITAYRQLYMLAHYPLAYFAALLAETPRAKKTMRGEDRLVKFMRQAMAHGSEIKPPCVLRSSHEFDVEGEAIRYGLAKIKGVASAADVVIDARPFDTMEELFAKVPKRMVNKSKFEALILSGALDALPFSSRLLPGYDEQIEECEDELDEIECKRNGLLARLHQLRKAKDDPPSYTPLVQRAKEQELLGLALSWWASTQKDRLRELEGLETIAWSVAEDVSRLALLVEVTRVKTHKTRRGTMAFLSLADETGALENVTIWAEQWDRYRPVLRPGRIVVIRLRRKENDDRRYGRWSYYLDPRGQDTAVESAQRVLRRLP